MKIFSFFMFLLFLFPSISVGSELVIKVFNPDKTPATNIKVQEVQLDRAWRGPSRNYLLGVTDKKGEIKVKFAEKPKDIDKTRGAYHYVYRYVVMPENYRWEISDAYWHTYPSQKSDDFSNNKPENWSIGKQIKIKENDKLKWSVVLSKGKDTKVAVVDQFGKPLRNEKLSYVLDLNAWTHTGFGGEVPISKSTTDNDGCFVIPNAASFYYTFTYDGRNRYIAPDAGYFTNTLSKTLKRDGFDKIVFHKQVGKKITIILTDKKTGKPVSEARIDTLIDFGVAAQGGPIAKNYTTDANGVYTSEEFYSEHVKRIYVSKDGYKDYFIPIDQFVTGKVYEIALEPKQ